ncbi:MAG TPA: ABC transporter substrate-binding protein [Actinomycetota bacterium]|nr:ABC transporter substrate-binding protein [Actinomycetota bacterium]
MLLTACPGEQPEEEADPVKELIVGLSAPGSLDPSKASTESAFTILRTACDGLTALDPETGEARAALAESWDASDEAKLLKIKLRPGVRFHDGRPVGAQAVRESLSVVARPETASPHASLLSAVQGFEEVVAGTNPLLEGIKVVGELDLEIRSTRPFPDLPAVLAHPSLIPVSRTEADRPPFCAGPYVIEQGAAESDFRLKQTPAKVGKNEAYASDGRGENEVIVVRGFGSDEEAFEAFKGGGVSISPVPNTRAAEAEALRRGYVLIAVPEITYMQFDPAPEPPDPRVRRALSLAIDRLVIIDAAYGDRRPPALRWLGDPEGEGTAACEESIRRIADVERAKQTAGASGVDLAGLKMPLIFDTAEVPAVVIQAIQAQVRDSLGITLVPSGKEPPDFQAALGERQAGALWLLSTTVQTPAPDDVFADVFRTGGADNRLGYSNPALDAVLDRAAKSPGKERDEAFLDAEKMVCQEMPGIPLWHEVRHWMVAPDAVDFEKRDSFDLLGSPVLRHAKAI